ncbi:MULTISPECIES: hypothetical protein [unclassified Flavobacterium]|uniref:hypothetical protein n=1 Tax=unclassified Flavobacterium TaxID=196869 RepID=UPI00086B27A3|nr:MULTISPECIES: hypothetical protein [unclassified Flavobacterium]MBN9285317.1 hypothetical protein [Flavobacterium sp.]ODS83133.1 MAG: hypothetical protein ABS44_17675 [Chryseobacterium sp. SCN 40-13]OJV71968.1 MAG: hypothetical protein BGO42_00970 [Flavobacterium sp. 40-81]
MALLKKYCNIPANSILESVIALTIISVCLYIAITVYAAVFTPRTSARFYNTQNKVNEMFYLMQLQGDSLQYDSEDKNLEIEEEVVNPGVKKIFIQYKDSTNFKFEKSFYIQSSGE